jgi:hypothetical protein
MSNAPSLTHANRHSSAGSDPVTPASIGAATAAALTAETVRATAVEAAIIAGGVLTPTGVKTANYTAAPNDLVLVDASAATRTVTLPTAPADKTQIGVKLLNVSGVFVASVAAGGSDLFNRAGGSATETLSTLNQLIIYQYQHSTGLWIVVNDSIAMSTFAPVATSGDAGDLTGTLDLTSLPAGVGFFVFWTGSTWQFNGTTITARPTSRTDLVMVAVSGTTPPSFGLTNDVWLMTA